MEGGGGIMAALDGCSTAERNEMSLEPRHTIFLSHSGAQKSFVEQLFMDIETRDRCPFFDKRRDSLPIGCDFPDLIFKAINQSEVAVVVLSEEFFSKSKWPMIELAALVKRKNHDPKLTIMPVFLGLSHAQCRDKGNQDRWVKQWQRWAEKDERIVVEEWMGALKVVGYTTGVSLSESDEVRCRREIVEAICKEVRAVTRADDSHVQGRSRVCQIIRERIEGLPLSKRYGVCILGLYGVGGIGKSTACMTLCNEYLEELKGRVCHVEFGDGNELQMLQKVLKKLTNTRHEEIERFNETECKDKMKRAMKNERVLLAIDNVSDSYRIVEQAKWMLGAGFGEGSIIIVTARSLGQLQNLSIHESECIEMPELWEDEAMSLFLNCVDPGLLVENVEPAIEQLMRQCVEKCNFGKGDGISKHYHPLALKVLGGQLGNDREEWFGKLKEMDPFNKYGQRKEEHPVFSILRSTFDSLNNEDQLLFMDVSVLFHPTYYLYWKIDIFEWLSMVHGRSVGDIITKLKGLKRNSLIEKLGDGSEKIGMHDLWQEFAYMEAKGGECDLGRWIYEVYDLDDPGREESHMFGGGGKSLLRLFMKAVDMKGFLVKYLVMELDLCTNLRVLKLIGVFPVTEILDVASLKHLKSLEIRGNDNSKLQILGLGCLRNLVFLQLVGFDLVGGGADSPSIYDEIGSLFGLNGLHLNLKLCVRKEMLNLSGLSMLRNVFVLYFDASSISGLSSKMTNLKHLRLQFGSRLRSCRGVDDLGALEELCLFSCKKLEELPHLGRLKNLLKLNIAHCELIEAVPGLGDLVSLQVFEAWNCFKLAEIPDMRKLVNLQILSFLRCPLIEAIPGLSDLIALEVLEADYGAFGGCQNLHKLTKLKTVVIGGWGGWDGEESQCTSDLLMNLKIQELGFDDWVNLKRLKIEFADLVNLQCLQIRDVEGVDELIGLSNSNSSELRIQDCSFEDVECLSNLTELKRLEVDHCDLERLPDMHKLSRLEELTISECESLREWKSGSGLRLSKADLHISWTLLRLQTLTLTEVAFTELPDLSSFPTLREIDLMDCPDLRRLTSTAPLTALKSLRLCGCLSLGALPELSHLVSLHSFFLCDCDELKLTAYEIEKLEAMCPGLELDKSHLRNMELEKDAKRLKS